MKIIEYGNFKHASGIAKRFPPPDIGRVGLCEFAIFDSEDKVTFSSEIIIAMIAKGYRPANMVENIILVMARPEMKEHFPLVALGSVYKVEDNLYETYISGLEEHRFLNTASSNKGGGWCKQCRFAAVKI